MSEARGGWLARLRAGLQKSSSRLSQGIGGIFTGKRLDDPALEALEELLIEADLGVGPAARLTANLAEARFDKTVSAADVRAVLAADIAKSLEAVARPLAIGSSHRPHVVLVVGVNGTGKTTTIAKLAKQFTDEGRKTVLAAGDTFRAAAIEQLQVWGERTGCDVVSQPQGADPAAVAYDALAQAREAGADVLLVDTAGRLHNKADLMAELQKIIRVMRKLEPAAPHDCVLVLDATIGQNAHAQVETFKELTAVTGLIVTKLDGTARGGVVVALAERFGLPIHAVGVGESAEDLRPFAPAEFAAGLLGL